MARVRVKETLEAASAAQLVDCQDGVCVRRFERQECHTRHTSRTGGATRGGGGGGGGGCVGCESFRKGEEPRHRAASVLAATLAASTAASTGTSTCAWPSQPQRVHGHTCGARGGHGRAAH